MLSHDWLSGGVNVQCSASGMDRSFSRTELPTIDASPRGRPQTRSEAEEMEQEQAFEQQVHSRAEILPVRPGVKCTGGNIS